jgi:hypothetical protein
MVELGTRCTYRKDACIGNSPPKTARAVFLSQPLEAGLQEQASNDLKLHRLRAVVVSVKGKS